MGISVCTLVYGRREHLANQLGALAVQDQRPDEFVLVLMNDEADLDLGEFPFPVRVARLQRDYLPLAAARNQAAAMAGHDQLVFLDVDCVPGPSLVGTYAAELSARDACLMGPVRYLAKDQNGAADFAELWNAAHIHPARLDPSTAGPDLRAIDDHGEFWSLSFAIRRRTFETIGGFDERFTGYGGEDTDFAESLRRADVPLVWLPAAAAVHQWHPVHKPPLQHFGDIIRNAQLFREKHGRWAMDYWLNQLAEDGYIDWSAERLSVLRTPSRAEIDAARQGPDIRFS